MHASGKSKGNKTVSKFRPFSALSGKIRLRFVRLVTFLLSPHLSYAAELSASWQHLL
jgi:hypothetical protein